MCPEKFTFLSFSRSVSTPQALSSNWASGTVI
ncbi:hypothetical protein Taro_036449 [Colocasia esculenta]|uniref:Uncharacterized protein n=1 Tax=Colocasia esculenta TaxID=4460 RepID=A0A843VXI8_COLES|nr:hypothetical protein [Colocasia esculenta]